MSEIPVKPLAITALISKISTQTDGGYSLTLSISETDLAVIQELLRIKSVNGCVYAVFQEITAETS